MSYAASGTTTGHLASLPGGDGQSRPEATPEDAELADPRKGYPEKSPFKIGTEAAISLDRETPRAWRFETEAEKLLESAVRTCVL